MIATRPWAQDGPLTNPWVRPYFLTAGRTTSAASLLVHALVSAPGYDLAYAARLQPEARALYERAHHITESVAELSAHCGVPLGVTRVLLTDLVATGHVMVHTHATASFYDPRDPRLLERVLDGLKQFV